MKRRDWILAAASCGAAAIFLLIALKDGKLHPGLTVTQVRHAAPLPLMALLVLTAVHIFLSNQKWRCVDAVLRTPGDAVPSLTTSFGMTSVGVALGQVLPIQLGVVTGRTLGTHFFGRPLSRGTLGSVFEQGFDAVVMLLLAIASVITLVAHGGRVTWMLASGILLVFALAAAGPALSWAGKFGVSAARSRLLGRMISQRIATLCQAGLLEPLLARKLTALSAVRFVVQVLMAAAVCAAIGIHISVWHLAAAIPLVILACVVVLTPGGIGVSELSYAAVLHAFGTPITTAVQWAVAARILISGSCFLLASLALVACAAGVRRQTRHRAGYQADSPALQDSAT